MSIKAIIGISNDGAEYQKTYHNVGAWAAIQLGGLAGEQGISLRIYDVTGYMNESGGPVSKWLRMNNLKLEEVIIAHDDSDLPIGSFKLSRGGGSAGHKGIESLVAHLGTEDFWRLRIGVRQPDEQVRKKAAEFVLDRWSAKDEEQFSGVCRNVWPKIKDL